MKKALIVCGSRGGKTIDLALDIGDYLARLSIEVKILSIKDFTSSMLDDCDYFLIGRRIEWYLPKSGFRHDEWIRFSNSLPPLDNFSTLLFSVCSPLSGLFCDFITPLKFKNNSDIPKIISGSGVLSCYDKIELRQLVSVRDAEEKTQQNFSLNKELILRKI